MATTSVRYLCSCGGPALISHLSTKGCFCRSVATRAVRPRSQSCVPMHILSPTSPATVQVSYIERWLSTTGPSTGQSKSSLKAWMQYLSRISPNVDASSMSRVLTSLHVDLPRNLPEVRRLFPNISFSELQQVVLRNRLKREKVPSNSNQHSCLDSKHLPDTTSMDISTQSSATDVNRAEVHDSAHLPYEEQPVTSSVISTSNSKTGAASVKQHVADSKTVDKPSILTSTSTAPLTDSVVSKFNTVASGIAKQIAEYVPTIDVNSASHTKPSAHLEQKQGSHKIDDKEKTKSSEVKKETSAVQMQTTVRRQLVARSSIDRQTRGLVLCLHDARTSTSQLVRLEELCQHIAQYPDCTGIAVKSKVVPCLLRLRNGRNAAVAEIAREALALVGYVDAVSGRGIRVLSLDGGGTKGLVSISIMRRLEELSQRRLYELFDYVCGVSTGSLIGAMATIYRVPIAEMEEIYKEFSVQMFEQNRLVGAGKLITSHAYYDTQLWETILKENIGEKSLLATNRDAKCPRFSAVSALVNVPRVQNFLFRNYNLPSARQSHYAGSTQHLVREAIRASSAAPGYYEECRLGDWVHQDGGLLTNNPTAIAIHECRLLWPDTPLQCVISIGTGKFEPTSRDESASLSSFKRKVAKLVESATDTEAVHTILHDLLPASTYFRFNPYTSEQFLLDEVRAEKWEQMRQDTEMYCRKNAQQLDRAASLLLQPKPLGRRIADHLRLKLESIR